MKRVAIQLCGHLRSYRETYSSLQKNVVEILKNEGYDVDIFIHTWTETDTSQTSWHNLEGNKRGRAITKNDEENVIKFYSPKKYLFENQIKVENDFELKEILMSMPRQYSAIINSSYTKFRVNKLREEYEKENNIVYDYVIQTRPDIIFDKPFGIDMFLSGYKNYGLKPKDNELYCTSVPFRRSNIEPDIFLCSIDLIFFAKPEVLNSINNLYLDITENKLDLNWIKENLYSLEILWLMYLKMNKIELVKLKYFQFSDYNIIRDIKNYSKLSEKPDASATITIKKKKNIKKKIVLELLKLLPYFISHKKIEKIKNKLKK